jgi:phosphoribosylaminoimidazolecarboxamide formyltransferase/IMP cyclohydrolase
MKVSFGGEEFVYEKAVKLRYGENPHQPAAFYRPKSRRKVIGGLKELKTGKGGPSQTNIEDVNNALNILKYFEEPTSAVMKHLNPSGVASSRNSGESLKEVYIRARDCDSLAAFGSVVGFNTPVDLETAEEIIATYVEVVFAPSFDGAAIESFEQRKNLRVIEIPDVGGQSKFIGDELDPVTIKTLIDGSLIVSVPLLTRVRKTEDLRTVTERALTQREASDLVFSWYVCMNVRSNGVVVSRDRATLGIGTGQQDRVTAVKLALEKAVMRGHGDSLKGAVLASDGFFPFSDSIELMAEYGVSSCVQPGGSIRDKDVVKACNDYDIAMVFTDERCFRHF